VLRDLADVTALQQLLYLLSQLYSMHFESSREPLLYSAPKEAPPKSNDWKDSLASYVSLSTAIFTRFKLYQDAEFTIIYDGYPKARYHALMLPRTNANAFRRFSVSNLRSEHLPMLNRMRNRARWLTFKLNTNFRVGFHSIPSLNYLHLHIIVSGLLKY
jgi:hypothetical protein